MNVEYVSEGSFEVWYVVHSVPDPESGVFLTPGSAMGKITKIRDPDRG
jgi:hypothetical protein